MDSPENISITVCGDGGCGKSSITLRLVRRAWSQDYDPTIEDSYTTTRIVNNKTFHVSITDTAGQEEYRGLWASSGLKSDAFLLVYDITNPNSLEVLDEFITLIDIETDALLSDSNVAPVKLIVGNKCDLQAERGVDTQHASNWARERGCDFMETSARDMINIEEAITNIILNVIQARRDPQRYAREHVNIYSPVQVQRAGVGDQPSSPFLHPGAGVGSSNNASTSGSSLKQKLKAKASSANKYFRSPRIPSQEQLQQEQNKTARQGQQDALDQEQAYDLMQDYRAYQRFLQDNHPQEFAQQQIQQNQHRYTGSGTGSIPNTATTGINPVTTSAATAAAAFNNVDDIQPAPAAEPEKQGGMTSFAKSPPSSNKVDKRAKRSFWKSLKCW